MKQYEAYRPTKYEWLTEVPTHWQTRTMRSMTTVSSERRGNREATLLSVYREYGVIVKSSRDDNHNIESEDLSNYKWVRTGDLVMNKMKMWQGSLGVSEFDGIVSPAYIVCHINDENVNRRYLHMLLRSPCYKTYYNQFSYGIRVGQWDMHYEDFKGLEVALPPREEQDQIVRYLDWQVSKINRLIAAKRKQIALLKEHRTAKINQAVTTGIHSDTQLAYTGYNWLPYAPANWKPVPAKALFRNVTELRRQDDSMLAATQKYGLIEQSEYMRLEGRRIVLANDNLDKWLHTEPNDFIISLRSFQGGLEMCSKPGCVTWHYVVLRAQQDIYPDFYKWFFKSAAYIGALQKTSDFIRDGQDLRFSNFVKVGLFNIPMDEQREIAEYLNQEVPKYDVAIDNLEKQIEQITELRTRLISDVVTGQVDVRGIEVPEYEYVAEAIESDENNAEVLEESEEAD